MNDGPRLPPAYRLVRLGDVDGTNAEAIRRAEAGAEEGTLIQAERQIAGRGRRGRSWDSPSGNLYMSLILRPEQPVGEAVLLSFVAAVSLSDALAGLLPPMIEITHKWPNDVLLNRHKVAGILLESAARESGALDWLVIGVGVNVEHFPDEAEYPATSLRHEGAEDVSPDNVMEAFARHFLRWTDAWREDGFAPIRTAWLARAQGIGEAVRVRLGTETFGGTFVDLDADGALLVEMADGATRRVTAGDVFPAAAGASVE